MEQQEETFNVSIEINPGLEPLTLNISIYQHPLLNTGQGASFKVSRNQESLGVLSQDVDHGWKQVEGNLNQEQVNAIGAAIDTHIIPE